MYVLPKYTGGKSNGGPSLTVFKSFCLLRRYELGGIEPAFVYPRVFGEGSINIDGRFNRWCLWCRFVAVIL